MGTLSDIRSELVRTRKTLSTLPSISNDYSQSITTETVRWRRKLNLHETVGRALTEWADLVTEDFVGGHDLETGVVDQMQAESVWKAELARFRIWRAALEERMTADLAEQQDVETGVGLRSEREKDQGDLVDVEEAEEWSDLNRDW